MRRVPLELHRIDDRLIHGQVVVGWGQPLDVGFIVLVDDTIAASDWEQELYRMALPPEMEVRFASVEQAARDWAAWNADPRPAILLTGDIDDDGAARRARAGDPRREPRRHSPGARGARSGCAISSSRRRRSRRSRRSRRAASR